jgi:dehydrogenase/reductase SDR family member 7B
MVMTKLKNKTVWITGASSGIGEALVCELSKLGASIILSSRNTGKLEEIRKRCADPEKHMVLKLDLEDNQSFTELLNDVLDRYSTIDILINCGAVSQKALSFRTDAETERKIMEVNYWGTVNLSKCVLSHMLQNRWGMIVVFSSVLGKIGISGRSSYSASKHALHGYFDSLRCDLRKEGYKNIVVKMVCPGYIKTNISFNYLDENGKNLDCMDRDHENAMTANACARKVIGMLQGPGTEYLVGGKEILAVYLKRYFQKIFLKHSYRY